MVRALTLLVALCLAGASPGGATTIHVPDDYPLIGDALFFAVSGDTVLVDCGTYYESGLQMKPGVTLISETGELGCVTIDAQYLGRIMSCTDCGDSTAVVGIRFASGKATSGYGGGIACTNSSPRLKNLDFLFCSVEGDPSSYGGGGLACVNSSPTLTNVQFNVCRSDGSTVGGGGGMVTVGQSSPTLNNVTFNMCDTYGSGWGGGLSVQGYGGQVVRLNNVTFVDNNSVTTGGALYVGGSTTVLDSVDFDSNWAHDGGGAVHLRTCRPCTLRHVTFTENTSAYGMGGGLLCEMAPDGIATMSDLTFLDNEAATNGGGMAVNNSTVPDISWVTFASNTAVLGGGIYVAGGPFELHNATFCQNSGTTAGGGIYLDGLNALDLVLDSTIIAYSSDGEGIGQSSPPAAQTISCTDIYGNAGGDWVGAFASLDGVDGNLNTPPIFCELLNNIFTLHTTSPCLPSGNECGVLIGAHGVGCPSSGVQEGMTALSVHPPAPNPFVNSTEISYELPADGLADVRIFDVSGRLVRTLASGERQRAGVRTVEWNGLDDRGRRVASGVYFLRVDFGGKSVEGRVVLLR